MSAPVASLAELLEPFPEAEFIARHWNREFKYVKGRPGRFETLLPWEALNRILAQHRLDEPRLKLVKEGKILDTSSFITYQPRRNISRDRVPRLMPDALSAELRDGATLILDNADELHEPLTVLAEGLERKLRIGVHANAYAGWRTSPGLDLHWDGHDVIVLQVYGRKSWRIYGATRRHPLANDIEANTDPPTTPIWEGDLESGDVLYIPRGVWHVAAPLDEPTLHLTIGFATATGVQLFEWITRRLRADETIRQDLPRLGDEAALRRHAAALRSAFDALWTPNILETFLAYIDERALPRTRFSLPFAAAGKPFGAGLSGAEVEWHTARTCTINVESDGSLHLKAHGRDWAFAAEAAPLLHLLAKGGRHLVSDLYRRFESSISETQIIELLDSLMKDGLLVLKA